MSTFLKLKKVSLIVFFLLSTVFLAKGQQSMSIGDTQVKNNAVLYLKGSGTQGLIIPIVATNGSFGEAGMIVYNSTDKTVYFHDGTAWNAVGGGTSGNANYTLTLSGNDFILKDGSTTKSTVPLAASPTTSQFLMWDGTKWAATALSQDIGNAAGVVTVNGIKGKTVPTLPSTGGTQILIYDTGTSTWKFQALSNGGTVTNIATGTGLTGGPITTTGTISVNVGTSANQIVQLDANGKLPAIDGSQLTSLPDPSATNEIQNLSTSGTGTATAGESFDIAISSGTGIKVKEGTNIQIDQSSNVLTINSTASGSGTVTSVALSLPTIFAVSGSPITASGTLTATLSSQASNTFFAGPSASIGAPTFRTMVAADVPALDAAKITTGTLPIGRGGTGIATTPTNGQLLIGNGTGYSASTLTQGSGITITNGAGTISISSTGLTNPMTTTGDIIYGGVSGAATRLAGATGFLKSSGAAAPAWSSIDLTTDATGTLPVSLGGTGRTTWNGLLLGSGATISDISTGTAGQYLKVAGTTPTWSTLSIMDADVNSAAAISGSKINPTFGAQAISSGASSQFAVNSTGNITKINNVVTSFPSAQGSANSVLVNDGAGTLTWGTVPGLFTTNNAIPRGNGSGLVASSIQDDGTTAAIGAAPVATNKLTVSNSTAGILQGISVANTQVGAGSSTAVRGDASGSTNTNFGLYGTATGGLGANGLYGYATGSTTSNGVYGLVNGTGITTAYGVRGSATSTSAVNYGVYGDASGGTTNWAGYFKGNTTIEGGLAVGATPDFGTSGQVLTSSGPGVAPTWTTYSGSSLISNPGTNNLFAGTNAGALNTSGAGNSFFGANAGANNQGNTNNNSFFGAFAGNATTTGVENTFIGRSAGLVNTTGSYNVFLGKDAGNSLITGNLNTFVGYQAGHNSDGINAGTFVGRLAGGNNTTGNFNTFIGEQAGLNNTTGASNVFVGRNTGGANLTGGTISLFGSGANVGADGLTNATAIGANAVVSASNTIVLGNNANVGIGTSSPSADFHVAPNSNTYAIRIDQGVNGDGFLSYVNTTSASRTVLNASSNATGLIVLGNGFTGIGRSPAANNLEVEGTASKTTSGGFIANSDRRIKTDIQEISNSFELMKKLHPVKFKYTAEWKRKHPSIKDVYYYNFIAQEFKEVFPESAQSSEEHIDGDPQAVLQIDTYNAQITTIKAVQELITKVEALEKENSKLKEEKSELEAKVNSIQTTQNDLLKDIEQMKRALGLTAKSK